MKRIRVELIVDEGFVAPTLRALANQYEDTLVLDEYDFETGTAIIEEMPEEEY